MPLLVVPLVVVAILALAVLLMPVSLVMRYRRGTARRQARGWVSLLNMATLAISAGLLLTTAAVTSLWVPTALPYTVMGLGSGIVLGFVGLWWSRWESSAESLHHTPNRWLVLVILLVVSGRIVYGFWRAWHAWIARTPDTSWLAAAGVAGSMAAGAVVIGYYLSYWAGVRRRWKRHQRTAGAIDVTATRVG